MNIRNVIVFLPLVLNVCCSNNSPIKNAEFRTPSGEIARGVFYPDSALNGKVNYYSLNNEYRGYTTYKYGYEAGPDVRIRNGRVMDSLFYEEPIKNGFEFMYDSIGKLTYKAHLLDGRVVGPSWQYDTSGNVSYFGFFNFEGELIYQAKYTPSGKYEKGSIINYKIHESNVNGQDRDIIFIYIIHAPDCNDFYELAVMNKEKKIVDLKKIETSDFFQEIAFNPISPTLHYAIIYHYSDKKNPRDKVIIQEIY